MPGRSASAGGLQCGQTADASGLRLAFGGRTNHPVERGDLGPAVVGSKSITMYPQRCMLFGFIAVPSTRQSVIAASCAHPLLLNQELSSHQESCCTSSRLAVFEWNQTSTGICRRFHCICCRNHEVRYVKKLI